MLSVTANSANLRSEPSSAKGNATVIMSMARGSICTQRRPAPGHPDWVEVEFGRERGFVKRMLCRQSDFGPLVTPDPNWLEVFNNSLWASTAKYESVTYKLGAKDPKTGEVDCSGWVAFINRLAFTAVNNKAGRKVFSNAMLGLLNTHSDHQVAIPGYRTSQVISGDDIDTIAFRPGLLIGINFSDYDWELNQGRVYEIDHIVQVMRGPTGSLYVTQSSSGGGGVNQLRLEGWLTSTAGKRHDWRMHMIDLFALPLLGGQDGEAAESGELELFELDTRETPAG